MTEDKKVKMIPVKVIFQQKEATLVEWVEKGKKQRVTVQAGKVVDGKVSADDLDIGIPYGVPWEQYKPKVITGEDIAEALHNTTEEGIWTKEDLGNNAALVVATLQYLYYIHLGSLAEFAEKMSK